MSYQNSDVAKNYIEFTNSKNGLIQQAIVFGAFSKFIKPNQQILDAGCGGGWLTEKIRTQFNDAGVKIIGCDFSEELISYAKSAFPNSKFDVADVTEKLPYESGQFDLTIFNMAGHDVKDLSAAFRELARATKPGGQILMTIANPYYAFPVGVWKRGLLGVILKRMPKLQLRPYFEFKRSEPRQFIWNHQFPSYFYTLPEYVESAGKAGLTLAALEDLESKENSESFDLRYRLFHFPMIQFLVFKKPLE